MVRRSQAGRQGTINLILVQITVEPLGTIFATKRSSRCSALSWPFAALPVAWHLTDTEPHRPSWLTDAS